MLADAISYKHWQKYSTYMICSGKSAIGSPDFPASISQAFKGLLERKISY